MHEIALLLLPSPPMIVDCCLPRSSHQLFHNKYRWWGARPGSGYGRGAAAAHAIDESLHGTQDPVERTAETKFEVLPQLDLFYSCQIGGTSGSRCY